MLGDCFVSTKRVTARALSILAVLLAAGCTPTGQPSLSHRYIEAREDGMREVRTVLVLDAPWEGRSIEAQTSLARVSMRWEEEFGIRFRLVGVRRQDVFAWTAAGQVLKLRRTVHLDRDTDLVILFSSSSGLFNPEAAEVLGNYVVIAPGIWDSTEHLLSHALGHTFGASHHVGPNNVMSFVTLPFLSRPSLVDFSEDSRRTILANKWRSFDRGQVSRPAAVRSPSPF